MARVTSALKNHTEYCGRVQPDGGVDSQPIDPCNLCYLKCKSQHHRIDKIEKGAWMPFCYHLWQGSCHVGFVDIIIQWALRADSADQR
jgi:hypothetical protein